jgi:hypothetical protein
VGTRTCLRAPSPRAPADDAGPLCMSVGRTAGARAWVAQASHRGGSGSVPSDFVSYSWLLKWRTARF